MQFETKLSEGKLIKRYKRFLTDVELPSGEVVVAHCANSGSMKTLLNAGSTVYLSPNTNPSAKLDWRWEIVNTGSSLVGINTARPNHIVAEAIVDGTISELAGYENLRREVKYGTNSRIDILLENTLQPSCYVEVKNATMCRCAKLVEFPDAVTVRGTKHLNELVEVVKSGNRAVMVYLVNRTDCDTLRIAKDIDADYYTAFLNALDNGVEALAYNVKIDDTGIWVNEKIKVDKF